MTHPSTCVPHQNYVLYVLRILCVLELAPAPIKHCIPLVLDLLERDEGRSVREAISNAVLPLLF